MAGIDGGSKHNAIPRECDVLLTVPLEKLDDLQAAVDEISATYQQEYALQDGGVFVRLDQDGFEAPSAVLTPDLQDRLLNLLVSIPHGVMAMSHAVPGLVETSTNMAVIKTHADKIALLTSQRSSVQTALDAVTQMVSAVGQQAAADVEYHNGYPAWSPNPDSALLDVARKVHVDLFQVEPEVKAIHAGLECGIIGDKFPGMDMISFGPTILGAHSPDERVQISTVVKFWDFLLALLKNVGKG